jgi:hypothetical protein
VINLQVINRRRAGEKIRILPGKPTCFIAKPAENK